MKKPNIPSIPPSEITPKEVYLTRREFIKAAGVIAGSLVLAACVPNLPEDASTQPAPTAAPGKTDELGDALTQYEDITNYVNYYEFTTNKQGVARLARDFQTSPWDVQVYGLVNKPQTFSVDDLVLRGSLEHGHPVGGFPAGKITEGRGTNRRCPLRPF